MASRPSFRPSRRQSLVSNLAAIADHLRSDPAWKDRLQFNEFCNRSEIINGHDILEPLGEMHVLQAQERIQNDGFAKAGKDTVRDAMTLVSGELPYHPVRNMLEGLRGKHDNVDRADHWLADCFGADDTPYVRAIGRMFLIAMVARIFKPGCQADYMLVLEGEQGIRKSTACRVLAGDEAFADNLPRLDSDPVRVSMALRGKWLIEVSEMDSFRGAKMETLKAFVTRRVEDFTPKYARSEAHEPRQCLLIGTTNGRFTYQDESGARRFWPVEVHDIDVARLASMREQLFAEAVKLYDAKEQHWPDDSFQAQHIRPVQEERRQIEPWVEMIDEWLQGQSPAQTASQAPRPASPFLLKQVWLDCLNGAHDRYDRHAANRIAEALRSLGWDVEKHSNKGDLWGPKPIKGLGP